MGSVEHRESQQDTVPLEWGSNFAAQFCTRTSRDDGINPARPSNELDLCHLFVRVSLGQIAGAWGV